MAITMLSCFFFAVFRFDKAHDLVVVPFRTAAGNFPFKDPSL